MKIYKDDQGNSYSEEDINKLAEDNQSTIEDIINDNALIEEDNTLDQLATEYLAEQPPVKSKNPPKNKKSTLTPAKDPFGEIKPLDPLGLQKFYKPKKDILVEGWDKRNKVKKEIVGPKDKNYGDLYIKGENKIGDYLTSTLKTQKSIETFFGVEEEEGKETLEKLYAGIPGLTFEETNATSGDITNRFDAVKAIYIDPTTGERKESDILQFDIGVMNASAEKRPKLANKNANILKDFFNKNLKNINLAKNKALREESKLIYNKELNNSITPEFKTEIDIKFDAPDLFTPRKETYTGTAAAGGFAMGTGGGGSYIVKPYEDELKAAKRKVLEDNPNITKEKLDIKADKLARSLLKLNAINNKKADFAKSIIENDRTMQPKLYVGSLLSNEEAVKVQNNTTTKLKLAENNALVLQGLGKDCESILQGNYKTEAEAAVIANKFKSVGINMDVNDTELLTLKNGNTITRGFYNAYSKLKDTYDANNLYAAKTFKEQNDNLEKLSDSDIFSTAAAKNYDLSEKYLGNIGLGLSDILVGASYFSAKVLTGTNPITYAGDEISKLIYGEDAQTTSGKLDEWAVNYTKSVDDIRQSYVRDVSFEDAFSNGKNFGKFAAQEISQQIPILIALAATGGAAGVVGVSGTTASTAMIGTFGAGGKMAQMQTEMAKGDADYSDTEIWLKSVGFGASEALFERMTTIPILKRANGHFASFGGSDVVDTSMKAYFKSKTPGFVYDQFLESAGETGTAITQNIIDGRPVMENVAHAGFSGFGMGTVMSGVPYTHGLYISAFSDYNSKKDIRNLHLELKDLGNQFELTKKSGPKKAIAKLMDSKQQEINIAIEKQQSKINENLRAKSAQAIIGIESEKAKLQNEAKSIADDKSIDDGLKELLIKDLRTKFKTLNDIKENALNPNNLMQDKSKFILLEASEPSRYNNLIDQATISLGKTGVVTKEIIEKEAYELYLGQEIDTNISNAGKVEGMELLAFDTKADIIPFIQGNDSMTDAEKENAISEIKKGADGFNIGNLSVVVKENMLANQRTQIGSHEVGHGVFNAIFKNNPEAFIPVANQLLLTTKKLDKKLYDKLTKNTDKVGNKFDAQEVISRFLESVSSGDISFAEKKNSFLSGLFGSMIQKEFVNEYDFDFKGQTDMFNFVVGLGKKIKEGTLTLKEIQEASESTIATEKVNAKDFKNVVLDNGGVSFSKAKVAEVQAKIDVLEDQYDNDDIEYDAYENKLAILKEELKKAQALPEVETKPKVEKPKVEINAEDEVKKIIKENKGSVSSDKVQKIYETKGESGSYDIIKLFKPITNKIVDKRKNAPGFDRDLFTDEIETGVGGILDLIKSYNKSIPLAAWINKYLPFRAIATSRRILDKQFSKDATEEKGLMATETADQGFAETAKEKPKYKNALESKVFSSEVLKTATNKIITIVRTLKSRIDAPVTLNKTVTPLISEIRDEVGKQLDIDIKTMLGGKKDGVLKKELLRTKRYILENMTTTWLMGKDGQGGIPQAIQKQINGKYISYPEWVGQKIDREKTTTDQAGRTSGAELVRRLPNVANNISDEVYLAQIIGPDGNPIRGRKESLSKAMAEEGAFDIINADFAEGGPIFEAFAVNQTRQGYEIANNTVVDFARQSDRGNVKFSKTYNNFTQFKKDIFNSKINELSTSLNPYLTTANKDAIKRIFKNIFIDDFSTEEINGLVEDFRPWLRQMKDMYSKNVEYVEDTNFNEKGNFESFIKNVATMHEEGVLDVLDMQFSHESLFSPTNVTDARTTTINMFSDWVDKFGRVQAVKMMIYSGGTFKSNASLGNLIGIQINPKTKKIELSGKKGKKSNQITENADDYWDNIVYNSLPGGRSPANQLLVEQIKKATAVQRKKDSASNAYKDRDFEGRKAQSLEYRKIVQETFSYYFNPENEISDAAKAIMVVQMGSNMETAIRKSAILTNVYIPKAGIEAGALRYEHTRPASQVIAEILNAYKKDKGIVTKEDLANIWDTYTAAVIPVSMDNNFNKAGFKSKMPPGWKKGMPTYYRYYNYATFGMENMFAMESIDPNNKEIIGEEFVKASDNAINGIKNNTKIKAIVDFTKFSKTPKGISVFDFDDTVGLTSGSVLYTMPDGPTGKLNAEEFAKEGGNMLDAGAVFDFSEFSKVVDGKPGPMVEKMKKMIGKFGPENFFILTARPANAAGPIHEFLSSIGIDIPLENITGLGSSLAQSKADWITAKAAEGYNDFYFADDAIQNVEAVKKALDIPGVNSKIQQARAKFSLTSKQDLKWKQGSYDLSAKFTVGNIDYRISMIETAYMEYDDKTQSILDDLVEKNNLDEDNTVMAWDGEGFNLEFWDKKQGNGITGTGNAAEVFGIVINGVTDRVKKKNIEALVFTAKESSRIRLYNSMAEVVADKLGWGAYYKDGVYILAKKPKTIGSTTGVGSLKPVQDVLKVVDINSPINQSKAKFSRTISSEFNKIIEENTGMENYKVFSDIVARRRGVNKNKFDFYVPPSAADFELLLYNFIGKGQVGEEQQKFFADALLKPYANGNDLMDAARQSIKNSYKVLIDQFPGIKNKIESLTPDGDFTYDQAIRVALWTEEGVEIPGISQRDQTKLVDLINNDPELTAFKQGVLVTGRQGKGWIAPTEYWDASTIISDLHNLTEGAGRKKFLAEFIENAEEMFGKFENGKLIGPNINKVEAVYGTNVREALEDQLYRMINGKNRSYGSDKETSMWSNWVNGSTGAIMFLNTRSAVLQLLGAINFLNLRDNNPVAAGIAFANQKQYWADFSRIWNSDKIKERRGGLKEDVAAAEIANAAAGSKNKVNAVISYLLKIGYTPTQLADSFAIASGGAPYYRNRINTYLKEGQSQEDAEKNAWSDFTKVSDETQQSGDPRDISKQQASPAGRLLLTFQNFSMQQSRIVKKSVLDLKNGRGNAKTHVSKIIYYLAVQNILFATLQQGLFAVAFDDDDEELDKEKDKAKKKTLNERLVGVADGVLDTILRGTGFAGGVISVLKNMTKKYLDEKDKGFKADYAKVMLEGANISPPIGSKLRKVYTGLQQTKFEKDLIDERGWGVMQDGRVHLGPMYGVTGKLVEATTNIPMDRLVNKIENVSQAMNSQNKAWQRVAVGLGFTPYSVGIEDTKGDLEIRAKAKATRKEAGKTKRKDSSQQERDSIANLSPDAYMDFVRSRKEAREKKKDSIANLPADQKKAYLEKKATESEARKREKEALKKIKSDSIAGLSPTEKANYNKKVAAEKAQKKKERHDKYEEKKKALKDSLAGLSPRERAKYIADKKAERHEYYIKNKKPSKPKRVLEF